MFCMSKSRYDPDKPVFQKLSKHDTLIHDQGKIWDEYERMFIDATGQGTPIGRQIAQLRNRKDRHDRGGRH
tara:strand:- start:441 stop:653 length:213 start_codon:yes stop_codon:yes gene_type:complete